MHTKKEQKKLVIQVQMSLNIINIIHKYKIRKKLIQIV